MIFSDLTLSRRLEAAEGSAGAEFAAARRRLLPAAPSEWQQFDGAYAIFDGPDSPVTQTFGLGLFADLTPAMLDDIERFFLDRGASIQHEVSPFAGIPTTDLLCARGYRPIEISNVLYRPVEAPTAALPENITVQRVSTSESALWSDLSARGWAHDHPEYLPFLQDLGVVTVARENSPSFLAFADGVPGATGVLSLHQSVAVFGGSSTIPELRRRGLQSALLRERMRYAAAQGCDLAMMVALPASNSHRNAERQGFRVAYTRTKWQRLP